MGTGTISYKDSTRYEIRGCKVQKQQALLSDMNIPEHLRHKPEFHPVTCQPCSQKFICNGYNHCR